MRPGRMSKSILPFLRNLVDSSVVVSIPTLIADLQTLLRHELVLARDRTPSTAIANKGGDVTTVSNY